MAELAMSFEGKALKYHNIITGPQGVRGRNSDNTQIKQSTPNLKMRSPVRWRCFTLTAP